MEREVTGHDLIRFDEYPKGFVWQPDLIPRCQNAVLLLRAVQQYLERRVAGGVRR